MYDQKRGFLSKVPISIKNRNFGQKSKFRSKLEISVKNPSFGQKSKFRSKLDDWNFERNLHFWNFEFWPKVGFLTEIGTIDRNFDHWPKLGLLTEIPFFGHTTLSLFRRFLRHMIPIFTWHFWFSTNRNINLFILGAVSLNGTDKYTDIKCGNRVDPFQPDRWSYECRVSGH